MEDFQNHKIRNITSVLNGARVDNEPKLTDKKPKSLDTTSQHIQKNSEKEYSLKLEDGFDDSDFQS